MVVTLSEVTTLYEIGFMVNMSEWIKKLCINYILIELLAKITFLQEAPKMEIANLLWYKE